MNYMEIHEKYIMSMANKVFIEYLSGIAKMKNDKEVYGEEKNNLITSFIFLKGVEFFIVTWYAKSHFGANKKYWEERYLNGRIKIAVEYDSNEKAINTYRHHNGAVIKT